MPASTRWIGSSDVNLATFETIVEAVFNEIPPAITSCLDNVTIEVASRPTRDQDPSGDGLLGLYEGVSLLERGIDYYGFTPDRITIFHQPHMDLGLSDIDLRDEIRTTVLHEIGHHLGISDDRLHELGWG